MIQIGHVESGIFGHKFGVIEGPQIADNFGDIAVNKHEMRTHGGFALIQQIPEGVMHHHETSTICY